MGCGHKPALERRSKARIAERQDRRANSKFWKHAVKRKTKNQREVTVGKPAESGSLGLEYSANSQSKVAVQELRYAGEYNVIEVKAKIAKLNGKIIKLKFKSVWNVFETSEGYNATAFNSLFRGADSIGISVDFPGLAIGWLSKLPKTKYRRNRRLSVGDVYEAKYAKKQEYFVYGKIEGDRAVRLIALGIKKTSRGYSW